MAIRITNEVLGIMADDDFEKLRFFDIQSKLETVFLKYGHVPESAQELAFYVAQGIRDVPELIRRLDEPTTFSTEDVIDAIYMVVTNAHNLQWAYDALSGHKPSDE